VNVKKIVSSESEKLILVDQDDVEIGALSKARCHDGDGVLHRAFSLFIFNADGELLLQKRSGNKRLWPFFWSNSCCSHPRKGESMAEAIDRRMEEELGITSTLEFVYKFSYEARYKDLGSENENCSVFLGRCEQAIRANQSEIAECRFIAPKDLLAEISTSGDKFTPWFRMEWQKLEEEFPDRLARYTSGSG
jgi:isopentenyl-diphosphate delta-isomerase